MDTPDLSFRDQSVNDQPSQVPEDDPIEKTRGVTEFTDPATLPDQLEPDTHTAKATPSKTAPSPGLANEPDNPLLALPNSLQERYQLIKVLGKGGFANVYLAHDNLLDQDVAIKILKLGLASKSDQKRFLFEARVSAKLRHPNIVTVFDILQTPDGLQLIMEYYPGGTLSDHLKTKGKMHVRTTIQVSRQIAKGLAFAHEKDIIHRDIKPANIFFGDDDLVKLGDFGIAAKTGNHEFTQTGMIIGTPMYMAPEQSEDSRDVDPRTDLYALGLMLYYMLTGRSPRVLDMELVPAEFRKIIKDSTEPERSGRMVSARQFIAMLDNIEFEISQTSSAPGPQQITMEVPPSATSQDGLDEGSAASQFDPQSNVEFNPPPGPLDPLDSNTESKVQDAPIQDLPGSGISDMDPVLEAPVQVEVALVGTSMETDISASDPPRKSRKGLLVMVVLFVLVVPAAVILGSLFGSDDVTTAVTAHRAAGTKEKTDSRQGEESLPDPGHPEGGIPGEPVRVDIIETPVVPHPGPDQEGVAPPVMNGDKAAVPNPADTGTNSETLTQTTDREMENQQDAVAMLPSERLKASLQQMISSDQNLDQGYRLLKLNEGKEMADPTVRMQVKLAGDQLNKTLNRSPREPVVHYLLAYTYARFDKRKQGIQHFRQGMDYFNAQSSGHSINPRDVFKALDLKQPVNIRLTSPGSGNQRMIGPDPLRRPNRNTPRTTPANRNQR
jgi:serine/threonine protein kinase